MKKSIHIIYLQALLFPFMGCSEFLDAKPDKNLVIPSKTEDLQALLENVNVFNSTPALELVASDEYFNTNEGWLSYGSNMVQQAHIRNFDQMFEGVVTVVEWQRPYQQIYYANTCLEKAEQIKASNQAEQVALNNVIGSAKFKRAFAFFNLIKAFGAQYDPATSQSAVGIPLPLKADVTKIQPFSSVEATYGQILKDLNECIELLPDLPKYKTRPSKAAAHALLARIYLSMCDFEKARNHAQQGLKIQSDLLDFNSLSPGNSFPVPRANKEVVYHAEMVNYAGFSINQQTRIDTVLYNSYQTDDLRKTIYFVRRNTGAINFRGSYNGNSSLFAGLTVSEMLLIRAECNARLGNLSEAVLDLSTLLRSRYKTNKSESIPLSGKEMLIVKIMEERKKELVFKGLRWNDIKRLTRLGEGPTVLERRLNGEVIRTEMNPTNLVFPIPLEEITNR